MAGSWYPGDPATLGELLDGFLAAATPPPVEGTLRAVISPHAGYRYSGATAAFGARVAQGRPPSRIVVLGPSHNGAFRGLSIPDVTHYRTPLGDIPLDGEAIAPLRDREIVRSYPAAHAREHSIEMQLPLLQRALPSPWRLVPVLVGQLLPGDAEEAAAVLRPLFDDGTLLVVSSDFTHYGPNYGYVPFPKAADVARRLRDLDMGAYERIAAVDAAGFDRYRSDTGITACGRGPIAVMLRLLPPEAATTLLQYRTSGELVGDYTNSVSYLSVAVTAPSPLAGTPAGSGGGVAARDQLPEADMQLLHTLACHALTAAVAGGNTDADALSDRLGVPERLRRPSGAFVTLKAHERLRGCIGTIEPVKPLHRAVVENAVHAALHDRRFQPVTAAELPGMQVEVSVLTPPRPVPGADDFTPGEHGIVLTKGMRRAVYLPEVAAEQGWGREETLAHLSRKAGLPAAAWREGATFEVFTTQKHEAPFPGRREAEPPPAP